MLHTERLVLRYPLNIDHAKNALVVSTHSERIKFSGVPPALGIDVLKAINAGRPVAELSAARR